MEEGCSDSESNEVEIATKMNLVFKNAKTKQITASNLPLLFANGRPQCLDTISQNELEEFVTFMIKCSLQESLDLTLKEMNNCQVPEWWPQGLAFKFPLVEQSPWTNRHVMLKSLVCRCYTFYGCEYLLMFSAELAEIPRSSLKFVNENEKMVVIVTKSGDRMVRCRSVNIYYDQKKSKRRYLSTPPWPKSEPVIDLTYDSSSGGEKEVYFKDLAPGCSKAAKRKPNPEPETKSTTETNKRARRIFNDLPEEVAEPAVVSKETFMGKLGMAITSEQKPPTKVIKPSRKRSVIKAFTLLSLTTERARRLLEGYAPSFCVEASLKRIEKYLGSTVVEDEECNQISTRSSAAFRHKIDTSEVECVSSSSKAEIRTHKPDYEQLWYHNYKWPHRTRRVRYPHRGPSLIPCSVVLTKLSPGVISLWKRRRHSVATNTQKGLGIVKMPICACQKIPLIDLDEEDLSKYKSKSTSTRCTCDRPVPQPTFTALESEPAFEVQSQVKHDNQKQSFAEEYSRLCYRNVLGQMLQGGESWNVLNNYYIAYTYTKPLQSMVYDSLHQNSQLHRIPLAVVPPTTVTKEVSDLTSCPPLALLPHCKNLPSMRINFVRSIFDAIKWYTKNDPLLSPADTIDGYSFKDDVIVNLVNRSQENIKPGSKITLPMSQKLINYFGCYVNHDERDFCFERASDGSSKLVTRRGVRHRINREPCPSCFQGRDNFCIYEFVRQAKLAGVNIYKNEKQLQNIFFKFIQAENSEG